MRLQVEISETAADKLIELALQQRRCPRQQAAWLLEQVLARASTTQPEECHTEEALRAVTR